MERRHVTESGYQPGELSTTPSPHSLSRRLLVAAITTLACVQVAAWSTHGFATLFGYSGWGPGPYRFFVFLPTCLAFWMAAALFKRWAARRDRDERTWFSSLSTASLIFCCTLLLASSAIIPGPWDLLRSVFDIPQSFQFYWFFGFRASSVASWSWTVLGVLLLLNFSFLGLFWIALRRAGRVRAGASCSDGIYAALALLWSSPALLYFFEVIALRYWSGMGDQPSELAELVWALPVQVATIAAAMLACCSWVRWCGVANSGRDTFKVAAAWGGLLLAHLALPSMGVYLGSAELADRSPYRNVFSQWTLADTDFAVYFVLLQNLEQGLYWTPVGLIFMVYLVAIVVLTVETIRQKS